VIEHEGKKYGVDVKTEFNNTRGSITIDNHANNRKVQWVKHHGKNKSSMDIVVVDNNTGDIYYKKGVGSFVIESMHKVKDMNELRNLIIDSHKKRGYPEAAKPNMKTSYHKALYDKEFAKILLDKALAAKLAKDARGTKSKAKAKALKMGAVI